MKWQQGVRLYERLQGVVFLVVLAVLSIVSEDTASHIH